MGRPRDRKYLPRVLDVVLADRLSSFGAVLVEGPKACGKTFTAEQVAASQVYLDLDPAALAGLAVDPRLILSGEPPQLVDEWQLAATTVWNVVRDEVNRRGRPGQFVLTGSSVPDDDARRHTGAGRIARVRMRPMSLFESGESSGGMSLAALMGGERPSESAALLDAAEVAGLVVRGGWPLALDLSSRNASRMSVDYLRTVAEADLARLEVARQDPQLALRLLRALGRNTAQEHKIARLAAEAASGTDQGIPARSTVYDYLAAFDRLMITELQPAWSTHLRSRARLRTAPRTHLIDPSLAAAAMGAGTDALLRDPNTLGFLFESLVVRDFRIYADPLDGEVLHHRDSNGVEVDVIVETSTTWAAFEVKLAAGQVDDAARRLVKFAATVDTRRVGSPAVLGVITNTEYGYVRDDGVVVVPVTALGP